MAERPAARAIQAEARPSSAAPMASRPDRPAASAGENPALAAALEYAGRGFAVFPLAGKVPRTPNGLKDASADPAQLAEWWTAWPDAGVAVRTGAPSGLIVLDVDPGHGGADSLAELEAEHGALPETVRCETGGGGEHYYFAHPGGEIRNTAGKLGDGLDTRGDGGYVVAPPSPHPLGGRYAWDTPPDEAEIAEAPAWLLAALTTRHNGNGAMPSSNGSAAIGEGKRNAELASLAGVMRRRGMDEAAIAAALAETNRSRCKPPLGDDEIAAIAASVSRYEPAEDRPAYTDLGNAQRFAAGYAGRVRHIYERRRWIAWDGNRWRHDDDGEPRRAAKEIAAALLAEAARLSGEEQKRAVAWAMRSQSEPRLRAALELAGTEREIVLRAADLDADPLLLSVANGTLDLRGGELRDADPGELLTLGNEIAFDPAAECPRWLRFLEEIFAGDAELVAFVRRLVGYTLTGDTREHVLVVLHGAGCNGKSTFIAILRRLLGDHAVAAAIETFMRQRDRGPRNDLARLHRARLVTAAESGEGRRLDEATVKEITGGDAISARFLYGAHFEFTPQFKLLLVTNHRPKVDGDDDAIWRRLRLVPFEQSFEGREDRELVAKLEAELPGILAWAVAGCLEWQRDGLGSAGAVTRATAEYRQDEDVLGSFLADRCELSGEVATRELRDAYESYCEELGEKPLPANTLGRRLGRRGIRREQRGGGGRVYVGVGVK